MSDPERCQTCGSLDKAAPTLMPSGWGDYEDLCRDPWHDQLAAPAGAPPEPEDTHDYAYDPSQPAPEPKP